jgi:hypothetical protein
MRWFTIYITESMQDSSKKVIRIHDIGDPMNVRLELQIGSLSFADPKILAIVTEDNRHEVAKLFSEKLHMPIEGEPAWMSDPMADVPLE